MEEDNNNHNMEEEENRKRKLEEEELQVYADALQMDQLLNADHDLDEFDVMLVSLMEENQLDDSDEEIEPKWGGSRPGKAPNKKRDFKGAYETVMKHYFNGDASL
jgi:hypothetical protein